MDIILNYNEFDTNKNYVIDREGSKKITGFASIDRPWEQFYRKNPIRDIKLEQTIYSLVFNENKDNLDEEALGYLGVNLTFRQLKEYVDQFADALVKNGVKKDDTILMGVSNSVGMIISLLGINKIGAISKWFDIRASEKDIEKYANYSNCKYMIAFDMLIPKIENAINNTSLEKVLIINPVDFLPKYKQFLYKQKCIKEGKYIKIPTDNRFIKFNDFMKEGNKNSNIPCVNFDPNKPSIMIQSSGTTGKPKTIVHSDLSAVSCTKQMAYNDLPLGRNKKVLVALPPWIAYGLGNAILMPLGYGSKVELSPDFEPDAIVRYLGKFTLSFAAPFHYRYLLSKYDSLTKHQKATFKNIETLATGGDKIGVEENEAFEKTFGCPVINGWGNNEGWGVLGVNPIKHNKYGTVGIPKCDDILISYDANSKTENKYGEIGELCALTPTILLNYEDNEAETKMVKKVHEDGKTWLHTGDLGYIDEEGFIHLSGRVRRVITRMGFKISAYTIEDKITEHYAVNECVAVGVVDEHEEHVPMAYIVLKDEYKSDPETIKLDIYNKCYKEMKEYEIPKYFQIVESLPITQNNKYDFVKLETEGNEYVNSLNDKPKTLIKTK